MKRRFACALCLLLILGLTLSYALLSPRILQFESPTYLKGYLRPDKSVLYKVLDIRYSEVGWYRARELSNAFNLLESQLLVYLKHKGIVTFFSPIHYIAILIIAMTHFLISRRLLVSLGVLNALLLSLIFVSSPAAAITLGYFRTGKVLCAVLLVMMAWLLFSASRHYPPSTFAVLSAGSVGVLALCACLLDEQGVGYTFIVLVFCVAVIHKYSYRMLRGHAIALILSLGAYFLYRIFLGPFLIRSVTGTEGISVLPLLARSAYVYTLPTAALLLGDYVGYLYGNYTVSAKCILLSILLIPIWTRVYQLRGVRLLPLDHFAQELKQYMGPFVINNTSLLVIWLVVGLNIGLVMAFPPIAGEDIRFVYYPLPSTGLILVASSIGLDRLARSVSDIKKYDARVIQCCLTLILSFVLVMNLIGIPMYKRTLANGVMKPYYDAYPALMACIVGDDFSPVNLQIRRRSDGAVAFDYLEFCHYYQQQ